MIDWKRAPRSGWLVWAFAAVASAWIVSTASAGAWHDDFEGGGLDDWVVYDFDHGAESWEEKDGFVVGETVPWEVSFLQLKPRKPAGVNPDDWNNYTVKVKMRLESEPEDDQDVHFGLMLYDRLDLDRHWIVGLKYPEGIIVTLSRAKGGFGWSSVPFNVERGVWYELTAAIETFKDSESLTHKVDGPWKSMGTTTFDGLLNSSGGAALVVSGGRVSFDDFVVEGESIPDGGNGLPRYVSPAGLAAQLWADLKSRRAADPF